MVTLKSINFHDDEIIFIRSKYPETMSLNSENKITVSLRTGDTKRSDRNSIVVNPKISNFNCVQKVFIRSKYPTKEIV